mmetsp:Transcript_895/g.2456  ORF Transcript_895/g.2456 Transcript_895/m.2456 type:complete len:199 (-) Transcript_895:648-1244(-)
MNIPGLPGFGGGGRAPGVGGEGARSFGHEPDPHLGMSEEERIKAMQAMQAAAFMKSASESCVFKATLSAIAGGGIGVFFGLVFGGYSGAVDEAVELKGTTREKLRVGFRSAARAMGSYAKSFALWGATFSGSECVVESYRARHDIYNSMMAGCITGATLASAPRQQIGARARTTQMAVACGGMAAFSTAIDYYMEYWE